MQDLPLVAKVVLNIILYILYVLFASVVFSFAFPLTLMLLGQAILPATDPIFMKIQIFIAFLVLVVSLILRRYFYISLDKEVKKLVVAKTVKEEVIKKTAPVKKTIKKTTKKKVAKKSKDVDNSTDEIKIYVDKEIK